MKHPKLSVGYIGSGCRLLPVIRVSKVQPSGRPLYMDCGMAKNTEQMMNYAAKMIKTTRKRGFLTQIMVI